MRIYKYVLLVMLLCVCVYGDERKLPPITVVFMASKQSWTDKEWTGHAFMVIQIPVESGVKEDGYGFYPREGGKGFINGPGVVKDEFENPSRFSRVTVSVTHAITDGQRRTILKVAQKWNDQHYNLLDQNCIRFVADAATAAGMKVPVPERAELPSTYMERLKKAN